MPSSIESLISGVPSLGSCAGVLQEIEAVLDDADSTLSDVGSVIEKDPDLTARLLRLGNSSFFGFPSRLETAPRLGHEIPNPGNPRFEKTRAC